MSRYIGMTHWHHYCQLLRGYVCIDEMPCQKEYEKEEKKKEKGKEEMGRETGINKGAEEKREKGEMERGVIARIYNEKSVRRDTYVAK